VTRRFKLISCALVLALVAASCGGGEPDSSSADPLADPGDAAVADLDETVEPVALAFVDSSQGSKMAISVAPNDAGIKWIDMTLDDQDQVTSVLVEADGERISIALDDDRFMMRFETADVAVSGRLGDDSVTVVSDGEILTAPMDLSSFEQTANDGGEELEEGAGVRLTPSVKLAGYSAGAGTGSSSLEYIIDRPLSVTGRVAIDVYAEATDGPVEVLPVVTQCSGSGSATTSATSCAPGTDNVVVTVEIPIARDAGFQALKEEHLGIFASRERCEAWSKHVRLIGTLNTALSAAMAKAVEKVLKNPLVGKALAANIKLTATVMAAVYARSGTVPCGTITVADGLVKDYRAANADFTVDLSITGIPFITVTDNDGAEGEAISLSTETLSVLPFSTTSSASVVLTATRTGSGDEATADEQSEPARATSGRWSGSGTFLNDSESLSSAHEGEATIELSDGVYSIVYEIVSVTTDKGHSACVTTTTTTGESTATPDENGRLLFETAADRHIVSDCKFYESSGGEVFKTTEQTMVGVLLEGDAISLNLVPQTSVEMAWTPL